MPPFWKKASALAAISLASWLVNKSIKKSMHVCWEKRMCKANGCCESHWISGMWLCCQLMDQELNECSTQIAAAGLRLRMVSIRSNMDRPMLLGLVFMIILCLCEASRSLHLLLRRDACSLLPLMLLAGVLVSLVLGWRTWLLLSDYRRRI